MDPFFANEEKLVRLLYKNVTNVSDIRKLVLTASLPFCLLKPKYVRHKAYKIRLYLLEYVVVLCYLARVNFWYVCILTSLHAYYQAVYTYIAVSIKYVFLVSLCFVYLYASTLRMHFSYK